MIKLSITAKEAIKTALAMSIAYAIALSMDWQRPYWAGFAVAFISLGAIKESLSKGFMRMLGTLLAAVTALTLLALFPQQRWWFMVMLSAYVGICTYMMTGKKAPYFYQVSAFVCVIICFDGGVNSLNAFETAVARIQETGMGIAVYALVTVFLWPQRSSVELNDTTVKKNITAPKTPGEYIRNVFTFESKRIEAVIEVVFSLWLSFLIWIYIDPPGHTGFVVFATTLSLALARFPSVRVSTLFPTAIISCIFSGFLYIFIMPHLSRFTQLGAMIFATTFIIAYLFSGPKQVLARALGLAFFATLTSISNQQTYSFSNYVNSSAMIILSISMLLITKNLPFRQQLCKERF